jgi:pimeloyl-ACP methyl ester carboxylesterase
VIAAAPPGVLVPIGTHRLHLHCAGEGRPAVVFDAALGASSLSWTLVQGAVGRITRACTYDRAGFAWSDAGPLPRSAGRIADELHALLQAGAVPPPYVLVGHSFGGLVMRLFTARHRDDVAAMVLIEPAIADEWADPSPERRTLIARGTRLCGIGATAARLGVARVVAGLVRAGALAPARAIVGAISRGGLRREDEGILAPIWKLPPDVRRLLGAMWTQPKFFAALGSQIAHICDSAADVQREASGGYGTLPLVVMTAAGSAEARLGADAALARQSSRGRHVVVEGSGHWIPLDAPQAVIETIASVVHQVRTGEGLDTWRETTWHLLDRILRLCGSPQVQIAIAYVSVQIVGQCPRQLQRADQLEHVRER